MKDLDFIGFSILPAQILISVVVIIGLVYVLLRLIKRYLFVFVKSEDWQRKIEASWPRIETSIWIGISFLLLIFMLNNSFLVTLVLLAVILVIGGKYWRDVINGIVIKFEHKISVGDFFSNEQFKGVITQLGARGLQIRMDGGEVAFVPYRSLSEYKIRKVDGELKSELNSIVVTVKPTVPIDSAIAQLKRIVLEIPYTNLTQAVKIEVVELSDEGSSLRVLAHTPNFETGKLLEKELKSQLNTQKLV